MYLLKQWSTPAVTESELELGFFLFFLRPTSRPDDNKRAVGTGGAGVLSPPDFGHSIDGANLNKSENFVTNTIAASKDIPKRPRIN